jgi:hypothetical protein
MHVTRFQLQKARVAVVAARARHVMSDNIALSGLEGGQPNWD